MFGFLILIGLSVVWYLFVAIAGNGILCWITKVSPDFADRWLEKFLFIEDLKEYHPCSEFSSFRKLVRNFITRTKDHILVLLRCCCKLILSLIKHLFGVYEGYFKNNSDCLNIWNSLGNVLSQRSFYFNFIMGLSIFLVISWFGSHWLITIEDEELDVVMQVNHKIHNWFSPTKGTIHGDKSKELPEFVFVDVDNRTHEQWKKPAFIPRDNLKNLIHFAAIAGARLIIVDVQLTIQLKDSLNEGLREFLRNYKDEKIECDILSSSENNEKVENNTQQQNQGCPPIILLRTFQRFIPPDNGTIKEPLEPRPTFLDDIVNPQESYLVQWASAEFVANEDRIRRWWLWQPVSYKEPPMTTVIPSIELLTAAMVCNDTLKEGYCNLHQQFSQFKPLDEFGTPYTLSEEVHIRVCGKNNPVLTASGGMYGVKQRIMYSMPWNVSEKETSTSKYSEKDKITIYSAKNIPIVGKSGEKKALEQLSPEPFKNAIVLIGGSYDVGHDNHLTPLGEMPGGLIVINAINSLLEYGEINELKPAIKGLFIAIFVLLMSVVFTFLESFMAKMLLGIFILLGLVPVSITFLGKGLWVDFALLLLVLEVFHLINEVKGEHGKHESENGQKKLEKEPIVINREV